MSAGLDVQAIKPRFLFRTRVGLWTISSLTGAPRPGSILQPVCGELTPVSAPMAARVFASVRPTATPETRRIPKDTVGCWNTNIVFLSLSAQSGWHGPPTPSTTHEVCICIQYQACRPLLAGPQPTRPAPQPRPRPPPLYLKPFSSNKRCIGKSAHRRPRDTHWESSRCPTTPQGNVRSCGTSAAAHRAHTHSVVPVPAVSDARGDMDAVVANSPGS